MRERESTAEERIDAIRLVKCNGLSAKDAAARIGCSRASLYNWMRSAEDVAAAEALGPVPDDEPEPAESGDLPPLGAEDPEAPSAEFMAQLADVWAHLLDHAALDHLAGWPEGTVQSWFERERIDRGAAIRVAQLRRAAVVVTSGIVRRMVATGNPASLRVLLEARGVLREPAPAGTGADGVPLDEIMAELARRGSATA